MEQPLSEIAHSDLAPAKYSRFYKPILVYLALLGYFCIISFFTEQISGNDSYFHIKYARLLWEDGRLWDFPWLQATIFKNVWIDHALLYHLLLIPFTWLGNLTIAAKAAAAFWAANAVFAVYLLIRSFDRQASPWQRFDWVWAIVLVAASPEMLYRLSNTRVQSVSLVFLIVAFYLMENDRHRWLLTLGFLYAWLYNGAIILLPVAGIYVLTDAIMNRRLAWSPCLYAGIGLVSGFVINPYFPDNLKFLSHHLQEYTLQPTPVPPSMEWVAYSSWTVFNSCRGAWACLLLGVLALIFQGRVISRRSLTFFFINLLFLVMFFRARRFVEYWPAFAVLFSASALQESRLFLLASIETAFPHFTQEDWKVIRNAVLSAAILIFSVVAIISARQTMNSIRENAPVNRFVAATDWLKTNTPKNAIVFNAQWDVFPDLFFHDHHNRWVAGLNEAFTYYLDPRLWELYRGIATGILPDTARYVKQEFKADYLLALKQHKGVTEAAQNPDNGLIKAWEDSQTIIYRVKPSDRFFQIEGEYLPLPTVQGNQVLNCRRENVPPAKKMGDPSAKAMLLCDGKGQEAALAWSIPVPHAGIWKVEGRFAQGPDVESALIRFNGEPGGRILTLKNSSGEVGPWQPLGEIRLAAGTARMEIVFTAPASRTLKIFGLDALRFTRTSTQDNP